ncbi:MAG: hypothetical protein R2845_08865 [Thermomicrobiales bacterium]
MASKHERPEVALKAEITRLRHRPDPPPVTMEPGTAYEAVTRQMVESLRDDLREIRGRINGLLFVMIGAVGAEAILRIAWG